ncbi:Abi family protein [Geomicrobium sp. JCM 19038]|uniref:Abi family protein n=1 Tax=Geomicrobium sp. JCM 19038 TaxID=1460635 RepID=UPI000693D48E|nr:Abi family protein [Geomicrobium sp. JCM 19038]
MSTFFYKCLVPSLKNKIATDIAVDYKREYDENHKIPSETVEGLFKIINIFRNVCAHEERMYNQVVQKTPKNKIVTMIINVPNSQLESGRVFTLLCYLKLVLTKKQHKDLVRKLSILFAKYQRDKFFTVPFEDIQREMGFPVDWKKYF